MLTTAYTRIFIICYIQNGIFYESVSNQFVLYGKSKRTHYSLPQFAQFAFLNTICFGNYTSLNFSIKMESHPFKYAFAYFLPMKSDLFWRCFCSKVQKGTEEGGKRKWTATIANRTRISTHPAELSLPIS